MSGLASQTQHSFFCVSVKDIPDATTEILSKHGFAVYTLSGCDVQLHVVAYEISETNLV